MKLLEKLQSIQNNLKAPKNQKNTFGNYNYRSCEDILEAVKPLLAEQKVTLVITDEIVNIGDRYYVKSEAVIRDENESLLVSAYARESETKKGMDESQITGACSSYARKYALNGLFLIDDTKDADAMDNTQDKKEPIKDTRLDQIKTLGKGIGFTGKTMEEFSSFIKQATLTTLEVKNYDSIIKSLTELNNIK